MDGNALFEQGKFNDAIVAYKKCMKKNPGNGSVLNQMGICYFNLGKYSDAIDTFKGVLRIKNDIPDVYNNIGTCYVNMRKYKEAEIVLLISLKLQQTDFIHSALANLYFYKKEYDLAINHFTQIQNINSNPSYLYNLGFCYLAKKDFKKGFSLYENRLKDLNIVPQTNEKPRVEIPWIPSWDGKDYNHLLIIYEQGIGDNIMFFRFIIELSRKFSGEITYFCKNTVSHLFRSYPNIHVVTQLSENIFDAKVYIMSLPYYLQIQTIEPNKEEYIITNSEKDVYWKQYFSDHFSGKRKIGFVHNGLLSSFIEKNIPLSEWRIFGDLENTVFISLGKGFSEKNPNFHFLDFDERPFEDTVSILPLLDLFITVDTAITHLAGVMNIPTWLLLGYGSDWRWFTENTSLWYSSLELIRMDKNKEMTELLPIIKSRLI